MSKDPGVAGPVGLLTSLQSAIRVATARETEINENLRTQSESAKRTCEKAVDAAELELAEVTENTEVAYGEKKQLVEEKFEARKTKIAEAHTSAKGVAARSQGKWEKEYLASLLETDREYASLKAGATERLKTLRSRLSDGSQRCLRLVDEAERAFRAFKKLRAMFASAQEGTDADPADGPDKMSEDLVLAVGEAEFELGTFRKIFLPRLFKYLSPWVIITVVTILHLLLVPVFLKLKASSIVYKILGGSLALGIAVTFILYLVGKVKARPFAERIAVAIDRARNLHDACMELGEESHKEELARIEQEYASKSDALNDEWNPVSDEAAERQKTGQKIVDQKRDRLVAKNEDIHRMNLEAVENERTGTIEGKKAEVEERKRALAASLEEKTASLEAEHAANWDALEAEWNDKLRPLYEDIEAVREASASRFPDWTSDAWQSWSPPPQFGESVSFAHMDVDVGQLAGALPQSDRLVLPGSAEFSLPLSLAFPDEGSLLIDTADQRREDVVAALNNTILRLFSMAPPGRLTFTIIDPVGLGENFAGIMHLADHEETLVNNRIWTQPRQIEERLADVNEHMEKVIQMYLRNDYKTITEYNAQAGDIAEKYHFLVIADFPVNFSELAAKRLLSIAASGARCGVYSLIHWDSRRNLPQDFVPDELQKSSVCVSCKTNTFALNDKLIDGANLVLDDPPDSAVATEFLQKVGENSRDSNRVELPFSHVVPSDDKMWSADTSEEVRVPVGRTGATKLQYLSIGQGVCQHALIAGKTGSGKSTLFHVMITNIGMWCSPDAAEFYLVDFKKGVEFKCYADRQLPHARVIAIESDREFGLSVLQRVDEELKKRGDLFRKLGVQDIVAYARAEGTEPLPRTLLMIDEFQEFFVEDDKISQNAALLLDRIVRQGRAFGIHVILGSQTLGGAYTLARTTLGQMVIRIALQCTEADSYLIMDDNNPAPRLLARPGEALYNDTAGKIEGNSPFQVVWQPDYVRDEYLDKIRAYADSRERTAYTAPIVFEGNAPANVAENRELQKMLEAEVVEPAVSPCAWLGAPNSIKGPTQALFHSQSGNNLLVVGQRDDAVLAALSVAMISLAAQYPKGGVKFVLFDGTIPGSPQRTTLDKIVDGIPHEISRPDNRDIASVLSEIASDVARIAEDEGSAGRVPTYIFVAGLQKFKKLRYEEDFSFSTDESESEANTGQQFDNIICEGARLGFHLIVTCDTYNNVNRSLSRKAVSEFEMRVVYQMSANDSASLIDSPAASNLGLHRAMFYNEQEGYLETYRPYAAPGNEWIEDTAAKLARLLG